MRLPTVPAWPARIRRNGGHSFMGYSVASGTLNINLSNLTSIQLAPDGRTAVVQVGGAAGGIMPANIGPQGNVP